MTDTLKTRFHGPWELFEVLDREFRAIDPAFPPPTDDDPWRIEADDVLNVDGVARRVAELKLAELSKPADAPTTAGPASRVGGTIPTDGLKITGPADQARLAEVLQAAWRAEPSALVDYCAPQLNDEAGVALREAVRDLGSLDEDEREHVKRRFNRQVLEAAFGGMLRAAATRGMNELLLRDRAHTARPSTDGELPRQRWALCLSGGGIRSATFSLGVIQALAGAKLLERFHYLSTVSGGGYVGSWLTAWIHREGREKVLRELAQDSTGAGRSEPTPVHHLRAYSNYLAPKQGLFTADTWTLGATVVRNLLLNWLVVLPVLAAVLMLPIVCAVVVASPPKGGTLSALLAGLITIGFVCASAGVWFVHTRRPSRIAGEPSAADAGADAKTAERRAASARRGAVSPEQGRGSDQAAFLQRCLIPIIVAVTALSTAGAWMTSDGNQTAVLGVPRALDGVAILWLAMLFGAVVHVVGWAMATRLRGRLWKWELGLVAATGALAGAISSGTLDFVSVVSASLERLFQRVNPAAVLGDDPGLLAAGRVLFPTLAFPGLLTALALAGFAYVGIASRWQSDEEREWSSRFSGWLLITAAAWLCLSGLVLVSAFILDLSASGLMLTGGGGVAAGAAAARMGRSQNAGAKKAAEAAKKGVALLLRDYALAFLAIVGVVLILLCLAALDRIIAGAAIRAAEDAGAAAWLGAATPGVVVGALGLALLLAGSGAARLIEGNRFSLHAMYRNRLIRAYLGASRAAGTRRPNPFTGFDPADNVQMVDLGYPPDGDSQPLRPLHVLNMALNVTTGSNLAWQERKARSFTVTALDAGACGLGYRRIRYDAASAGRYGGREGVSLGTAMAISGAAASPNMGYHSSPPVTFLMALFNARLGWWLGNPGWAGRKTFHHPSPRGAIAPIFLDLLGMATDSAPVVYLSDGGHFENLGLYEMVLRRSAVIVVADGGCDEKFDYADLGNAVRKIRVDLGIPIDFPNGFPIKPLDAEGGAHLVCGVIRYSEVDPGADDGVLIYVKPTLTGDEARDIVAYSRVSKHFPHESTIDQFFEESQFESYRELGHHSGVAAVAALRNASARGETARGGTAQGGMAWGESPVAAE